MSSRTPKRSFVERIATKLKLIPELDGQGVLPDPQAHMQEPGDLSKYPPPEQWDDWSEWDANEWPNQVKRNYTIVPTTCFNCESACGLLGYIDNDTGQVRKFEGNPYHPGSRGRNCAKGPATINQINDEERILYPLKRDGERGAGQWKQVSWDEVLKDIGGRIGTAIREGRNNEIVYHVGRPGHEGYMDRVLNAWGVDGHNSHTNVCSSAARLGYTLWHGYDRPSPDHANADFILLVSAHLESGHYFNPHAQRIIEGLRSGAELAVMDPRLSNTASVANYWMPTQPGSEAAVLLAMANILIRERLFNEKYVRDWVNWREFLQAKHPERPQTFESFIRALEETYAEFTPEFAASEARIDAETIVHVARRIGKAGSRFATHTWRSASAGNLGGWCVARALQFLNVLTGSVGTKGGTSPSSWNKFKPKFFDTPPAHKFWNELHFPNEYPLSQYEMSILLPHMLKQGRGKIDTYFSRVFNPVWSYPDGFSWIEMLQDESKIGMHIALTPTWNETAYFADYVLPMGHASERHDLNSYETHSGMWIAFRQPILREAARRRGETVEFTYQANPGEVWEEDEFWIELSWNIDPDASLGIQKHFLSPYRENQKVTVEEYYQFIFENVKGLPETAAEQGLTPLEYMKKYGAFEIETTIYEKNLQPPTGMDQASIDSESGEIKDATGTTIGWEIDGQPCTGFNSPSRKQELYSQTMADWGWPEYTLPTYIHSQVHPEKLADSEHAFVLVPTFRLPTLIHSRSGNAKWLAEISNQNPLWMHTSDAARLGIQNGSLVRVSTEIGHYVDRVWVTEGMKPGVVACSHHLGRWRRDQDPENNRWATNHVDITNDNGIWNMRLKPQSRAFQSNDPDSQRAFWGNGGVAQNLIFPVQPDPISGMHCWHQSVLVEPAQSDDRFGDVRVDTNKSYEVYLRWLKMTRPAPGPNSLRRPLWFKRPLRPDESLFYIS